MTARTCLAQGLSADYPQSFAQAVDKLMAFCTLLLQKNKVMNLTGAKDELEVVTRHFLDCAAAYAPVALGGKSVVDVGCGAGFPGVPITLLFPDAQVTLLDSLQKRIRFLQECISEIAIGNAVAVHARAEEFAADHRERYDVAVSRAVADLRVLAELSLPLVKVGGLFLPMKSTACDAELAAAHGAVEELGGEVEQVRDYQVHGTQMQQRLVYIRKVRETPGKYPRRFSKISAQPL